MCDLTHPFALVAEKLLLKGDRDAEEALCGVHISTVREADAMLNLLEQVVRAPHEHCDDGIMYFVRFLEYPGSSAAAEQLLRRGLPLFDSLAGRLPATSWAWGQILHAMAHWANRGSTESLRCWLKHFLADDPLRDAEIYEVAIGPFLDPASAVLRQLFPTLRQALTCPVRRKVVLQLADLANEGRHAASSMRQAQVVQICESDGRRSR